MAIQTINPTTEKILQTYSEMEYTEVAKCIEAGHQDFLAWRNTSFSIRSTKILQIEKILLENKRQYAELISTEMGKPIKQATSEIEKCAWQCRYFAEQAEAYLQPHYIKTEMAKSYVLYQPLGVIFAIMPWNFPFWQVFRFAIPALMAGNACILKHAPNTTECGLVIEKIFAQAGLPENLFRTIVVNTDLAEQIIAHPKIRGVTLTGSVKAGRAVGAQAAGHIKKVVLELGGNDPYLVLEDADIDLAVEQCVTSRLNNTGQVCIAAKRFVVVEAVRDIFEKKVLEKIKQYKMGNPLEETTSLEPLARADLRDTVHKQVQECIAKGAELVTGGEFIKGPGFFYPITVLKNIKPGMPAYEGEIFGPVIAFFSARDEAEAIKIANDSSYGLGAAVFTTNNEHGERVARQLEVGACGINTFVSSDPRLPFGGTKESGFGRELSAEGIREFTNIKTVCLR